MSIALKPEQQQFIQQQIALGRFGSEEEVLEKALQLLSSQYREYDNWVEDTRAKIDEAQAEIDRGDGIPLDVAMTQLHDAQNERLHQRLDRDQIDPA
jgi:antitoxin ParD1/3/4